VFVFALGHPVLGPRRISAELAPDERGDISSEHGSLACALSGSG
jgi:hypothetical protein